MKSAESNANFSLLVLSLLGAADIDLDTRFVASVYFKNLVRSNWDPVIALTVCVIGI